MRNGTIHKARSLSGAVSVFLLGLVALSAEVLGQPDTGDHGDDEIFTLSPFTVLASEDDGYRATSSLAGSRLKTDLKDIASQIDVMTMEFADDIGATTLEDIYEYSSSMESARDFTAGPNGGVDAPNTSRVRGFDNATQSSDFFKTNLGSDFYNKERITIANGPNSILFGLGLPGGIVNTQTKSAAFRDEAMIKLQIDDWGGVRSVVDYNKMLIEDTLAIRLIALDKESETFKPGEFDDQERYYAALTYRPVEKTTLKIKYEDIDRQAAKATNFIAQDFVSPWFEAGKPLFDNSVGHANGGVGNTSINNNSDPHFRRNNSNTYFIQYGAVDTVNAVRWAGTSITKGPHQLPGALDRRNFSLVNYDILPAHVDPRVGGRMNDIHGELLRASWEQKLAEKLHLELAYSRENRDELSGGMFQQGNSLNVRGDANKYLSDGVTLNPNAGRLYIESDPRVTQRQDELEELRLTLSYELDFAELSDGIASGFGRHRLAALVSQYDQFEGRQSHRGIVSGGDALPVGSFVGNRFYLDSDSGIFTATNLEGKAHGPWTIDEPISGGSATVSTYDNPNGAWRAASLNDTDVDSKMIAVQSFFLEGKLNAFYGLRNDSFTIRGADSAARAVQSNKLFPHLEEARVDSGDPRLDGDGNTSTFGVVARPITWLSVHYNKADNFQVPNGALSAFGEPLPGVSSEGDDYGVRFDFANNDNRFAIRLNRYTDSQLFLQSGLSQKLKNMAGDVERTLRDPNGSASMMDGFVAPDGFFFLDNIGESNDLYAGYSRKAARGTDIIGTGSFGRNLNVRVAIGQQNTLVFDRAGQFRDWVSQRLPVWQDAGGLGWGNIVVEEDGTRTIEEYYNEIISPEITALEGVDGLPRFRQREWRANVFANYKFTEGIWKGFDTGLGIRWRDNAMVSAIPLGNQQYQKQFSPEQWYFDVAFGYRREISFAGKNANWNARINVRNLSLHDKVYMIRGVSDLSGPLDLAYDLEPQVTLTNTIRF